MALSPILEKSRKRQDRQTGAECVTKTVYKIVNIVGTDAGNKPSVSEFKINKNDQSESNS